MNEVKTIPNVLLITFFAKLSDILSRGDMSHFQAAFKSLDLAQLMSLLQTTSVGYILLPLNNADSLLLRIFFNSEVFPMKRRHTPNDFNTVDYIELSRKTAIHEAGHAAAIHFRNKQKQLPPVFFRIIIGGCLYYTCDNCQTKVDGGRLIHTLPSSIEEAVVGFSAVQKYAYQQAFEADIVNLLVGALAEANYVAERDNELISPRLVPLHALHNYGGSADLEIVDEYLECFIADTQQQETKITELFCSAFDFINDWSHWYAITALADYILSNNKNIINYQEVVTVLDSHYSMAKKRLGINHYRPNIGDGR